MKLHSLIFRAYIAAARNEQWYPATDTKVLWHIAEPVMCSYTWEEPVKIAKLIYKLYGFTASEQFRRGIVQQPGRIHNLLICSELRRIYGDLSGVPGFDHNGNFKRERYNDVLVPERKGNAIVALKAYASRQLEQEPNKINGNYILDSLT